MAEGRGRDAHGHDPARGEELLAAVFDQSPVAVLRVRRQGAALGEVLDANAAAADLLDLDLDALVGARLRDVLPAPQDSPDVNGAVGGRGPDDHRGAGDHAGADPDLDGEPDVVPEPGLGSALAAEGPWASVDGVGTHDVRVAGGRWVQATVTELHGRAGEGAALVVLQDVTERRSAEDSLHRAARHDALTGLVNREELLRQLATVAGDPDEHVAVLFLDLDGFKLVNDTRGHHVGDDLLVAVAGRIRGVVRPEDVVGRLGGDEFVVVCPHLEDPRDALVVAERVRATLDDPIAIEGRSHRVTMSLGIASAPMGDADGPELLRQADMAMYRAKDAGRNTIRYHSIDMDEELAAAERLREDLAAGLAADGLVLHFQPIVEIATGQLQYMEALTRLRDRDGELVYPSDFLPVAGRAGLHGRISEQVLRLALRQRALWRAEGLDVAVGLNLALGQVLSASFARDALGIIAQEGDEPSAVVFEMGEVGLLDATGPAQLTLRRLRSSGIGLAIDHFGTGYSSLGALRFLGPHRVKIDRSFVASITTSAADRAIVSAAISAAHALGQRVVAEGVEQPQQLALLAELGCDEAQGFLIGPAAPPEGQDLPGTRWEPVSLRHYPLPVRGLPV